MQTQDDDAGTLLKRLTFKSLEDIENIMKSHEKAPHLRSAQSLLANEVAKSFSRA